MTVDRWFPTVVWTFDLAHRAQSDAKIVANIYRMRTESAGVVKSNEGGWQSNDDLGSRPEMQELIFDISQCVDRAARSMDWNPMDLAMQIMWANVNTPGARNRTHYHSGAVLSGVYWLEAPENSGDLSIVDPRAVREMVVEPPTVGDGTADTWREVLYSPTAHTLVLFPAWLGHHVGVNNSAENRVSVAFNFALR